MMLSVKTRNVRGSLLNAQISIKGVTSPCKLESVETFLFLEFNVKSQQCFSVGTCVSAESCILCLAILDAFYCAHYFFDTSSGVNGFIVVMS